MAITSPGEEPSFGAQIFVKPLPTSSISLEEGLRWDAKGSPCEHTPIRRILTI